MIRKLTFVLGLFILAATVTANNAAAQDFKKRAKDRYRVDVLVPLYLDELVKGSSATYKDKMPEKAQYGVGFYAGITLAADSLKNSGFNVDIYVHDIASAKESPDKLASHGLDSSDLIIGSVPPDDAMLISTLAKKKSVNFISTSSASFTDSYNNPYLTFLQPSLKTYCGLIVDDVVSRFPKENVVLLYRTKDPADAAAYDYITDGLGRKVNTRHIAANSLPKKGNFSLFIDAPKNNIIIIPVQDIGFADSVLHELSRDFPGTHFDVYGMPSWSNIEDLHKDGVFPTLSVNIPSPHTLAPSSPMGQYVKHTYRQIYSGKMPGSTYYGYEVMFWYAGMLRKYGIGFNEKYTDNTKANFAHFDIQPQTDKSGNILYYENKCIFLDKRETRTHKSKEPQ